MRYENEEIENGPGVARPRDLLESFTRQFGEFLERAGKTTTIEADLASIVGLLNYEEAALASRIARIFATICDEKVGRGDRVNSRIFSIECHRCGDSIVEAFAPYCSARCLELDTDEGGEA